MKCRTEKMPDKKALWMLNELEGFEKPKIKLEQYATSSELAVSMMEMIDELIGLENAKMIDIGCGCGMLMITAATLYEVESALGVDIDAEALAACSRNLETANALDRCTILQADILVPEAELPRDTFDIAVINPPFGTKNNAGIDMRFVQVGLQTIRPGGSVFSLHKTSTRDYILKKASKWNGVKAECCAELRWQLPATYKFHKQKSVDIAVDLIRFEKTENLDAKDLTMETPSS